MERIFYGIVTQFDCDEASATKYSMERKGPLLFECYLNEWATDEARVRQHTTTFTRNGWARVAKITVDIPESDDLERAAERERFAKLAETSGDTETAIEARAAAWRAEQTSKGE